MHAFARPRTAHLSAVLCCAALATVATCDSLSEPQLRVPAELRLLQGDTQTAVVGEPLTDPLVVRVLNRFDDPIPDVEVEFVLLTGGGTLAPAAMRTDAQGTARAAWTLGTLAGVQTAAARVPGGSVSPVLLTALATPGPIAELAKVSGDEQPGTVGEPLPEPLIVQARDAHGNGIPGMEVRWIAHYGSLAPDVDSTDTGGFSRTRWTLSTQHLEQYASAEIVIGEGEEPEVFRAGFRVAARPGRLLTVKIVPEGSFGFPTSAIADSLALLHPAVVALRLRAVDVYGNEVEPTTVSWSSSVPGVVTIAPGETASRVSLTTNAGGDALIQAAAGGVAGTLQVRIAAVARSFTVTDTGLGRASAVNDRGEVATPGSNGVVIWQNGQTVTVPTPGGYGGGFGVQAINNTAAILIYQRLAGHTGVFGMGYSTILKGGGATTIPDLGATGADINDDDVVVGARLTARSDLPGSRNFAFVWADGQLTDLHTPTFDWSSYAVAVNSRTQVAINTNPAYSPYTNDPQTGSAFLWEAGRYSPIPRPNPACLGWIAMDLNDAGDVLLNCGVGDSETLSFLWDGTAFTPLTPITYAVGLNDRGEVVGKGQDGVYLWRRGHTIRLLDAAGVRELWINNAGNIVLNFSHSYLNRAYFLTPSQ